MEPTQDISVGDLIQGLTHGVDDRGRRARRYGPQNGLGLGEHFLDRRQIGTVDRQPFHPGSGRFDRGHHRRVFMRWQVVKDDDIPGRNWHEPGDPLIDGADFRAFPRHPFHLGRYQGLDVDPDVLELPVGGSYVPALRSRPTGRVVDRLKCGALRMLGQPCGWLWLRPTSMSRPQMRACLEALRRDRVPVWVAMIHSSEIIPCQPLPTEDAVARFVERCLQLVEDAVSLGATCSTFTEVQTALLEPALAR